MLYRLVDRRSFVRASAMVAGGAALGAAVTGGALSLVRPRAPEPASAWYYGAHRLGGPAPVGTPYVPLVLKDGAFHADLSAFEHRGERFEPARWHVYCGAADLPTADVQPLVYWREPETVAAIRPWYADRIGEPVRPEDFADVGFGAATIVGTMEGPLLRVTIVRWGEGAFRRVAEPVGSSRDRSVQHVQAIREDELAMLRERVFHEGFVAAGSACTHFCCTSGFKESETLARPRGASDELFCTCHAARFELREPVRYRVATEPIAPP